MKKKIVCVLALLFGLSNFLNAYGYVDIVEYLGTTAQRSLYGTYKELYTSFNLVGKASPVSNATDEELRLLWQGLKKYNYKAGEIYVVRIKTDQRNTFFFVEIEKDGSCSWYACTTL